MKGEATILLNYCLISLDNIDKIVHSFDVGFNGLRLKSIWFTYLMTQLLYYLIALLGSQGSGKSYKQKQQRKSTLVLSILIGATNQIA